MTLRRSRATLTTTRWRPGVDEEYNVPRVWATRMTRRSGLGGEEGKALGAGVDKEYNVPGGQATRQMRRWGPASTRRVRRWGLGNKEGAALQGWAT